MSKRKTSPNADLQLQAEKRISLVYHKFGSSTNPTIEERCTWLYTAAHEWLRNVLHFDETRFMLASKSAPELKENQCAVIFYPSYMFSPSGFCYVWISYDDGCEEDYVCKYIKKADEWNKDLTVWLKTCKSLGWIPFDISDLKIEYNATFIDHGYIGHSYIIYPIIKLSNQTNISYKHWTPLTWSPQYHDRFHPQEKERVKTVLMMAAKKDGIPNHPESHFFKLPRDIIYVILGYAIEYW